MINSLLSVVLPNIARTYRMINQYVTIIKHNFDAMHGRSGYKNRSKASEKQEFQSRHLSLASSDHSRN